MQLRLVKLPNPETVNSFFGTHPGMYNEGLHSMFGAVGRVDLPSMT